MVINLYFEQPEPNASPTQHSMFKLLWVSMLELLWAEK